MAQYGAKHLRWAKMVSDADPTANPKYEPSIGLGPLVLVTDSITRVTAENHGDDDLQEYVDEFQKIDVDVEVTTMPMATAKEVYGATLDDKKNLHYSKNDSAPDGGLAFYTTNQVKVDGAQRTFYQGLFYPSLKGSRQGATYNTKGQSITFANGKAHFVGKAAANGDFQVFSDEFATEAEAKAWVDEMLPPAPAETTKPEETA